MEKIKLVILGPSSTGKSTIGEILKDKYELPIFECDDETRRLNGGTWPKDEKIVDRLFEQVNKKAQEMEHVIYVTSFLNKDEILAFAKKGFKFVVLEAEFDFLLERRLKREKLTASLLKRFKRRYKTLLDLVHSTNLSKHFPLRFDIANLSNEQVASAIVEYIS